MRSGAEFDLATLQPNVAGPTVLARYEGSDTELDQRAYDDEEGGDPHAPAEFGAAFQNLKKFLNGGMQLDGRNGSML